VSIALFTQILANFPAARAHALDVRSGVEAVYALAWPDYEPPVENHPANNRLAWDAWRYEARLPLWAWINCSADQAADAATIATLDTELDPSGWLLDIEGEWVKGANLEVLIKAAVATGKPVRASLAGASASHTPYDFRTLDRYGVTIDWQAYFDSLEGPPPEVAVRELYQSSFVLAGWEYRHRLSSVYGWGKVTKIEAGMRAGFDSYKRPGTNDATFAISEREWGYMVAGRDLVRDGKTVGLLMGRAAYPKIRVTLDCTRTASTRTPQEWISIAASARMPGSGKRPCSVYLAENASDDVIAAIAEGAA
jgi:hypothetical protein